MKIIFAVTAAMVAVLSLFLLHCSDIKKVHYIPVEGIVTAKEWIPSHYIQQFVQIPNTDRGVTVVPYVVYRPEEWRIHVGSRYVCVTEEKFKKVEIQKYFKER